MSFSNPKLSNPCSKFIEFKGDSGVFQYWDKERGEHGENVQLPVPCFIVVLDQLSTIKGFSDELQSGIYSNEVHSLANEILRVKSFKGGLSIVGLYNDIKHELKSEGAKFAKSVYCMLIDKEGNNHELINFQLSGAAFSAWLDFKFDAQQHIVEITGDCNKEKKGSISYFKPIFKRYAMKKELVPYAIKMDKQLQAYLKQYQDDLKEQQTVSQEKVDAEIPVDNPVIYPDKTPNEVWHENNYDQDKHSIYGDPVKSEVDPADDLPF